jgi:hypothetical protein
MGVSHSQATKGTSRSNAAMDPTGRSPIRIPSLKNAFHSRSDARGTTAGCMKGPHWPTSTTRSDETDDALLLLQPSSQLTRPAGYSRTSSYSADEQSISGGIAGQEPGYAPDFLSVLTNQQFAPPAITSSEARPRSRQPSLDIWTQSSNYTLPSTEEPRSGNTGYFQQSPRAHSPYATPSLATPSMSNNQYLLESSLSGTKRYPSMTLPKTHVEGSCVRPSRVNTSRLTRTKMSAPFAAKKPRNPTRQRPSGQTSENFMTPYPLGRAPPPGLEDVLRSFSSASGSSSRVLSQSNPYGYPYNEQHAGDTNPEISLSRPGSAVSNSSAWLDEEQVYSGITSQGGAGGHIEQSVGPASGDSGNHRFVSSFANEEDPELGLVRDDSSDSLFLDSTQPQSDSESRFAPTFEYTQDPLLTFQDQSFTPRTEQRIVTDYMEYQAPVVLYEISPENTGCYYA